MKIEKITLSKLVTDKLNPRESLEELEELADSIQKNGQQIPLNVEDLKDGTFLINNGHRRQMAFKLIKKRTKTEPLVDCIVENKLTPEERLIKQAVIDVQTKNWSVEDRDAAWKKIWTTQKYNKTEFEKLLGTNQLAVELFLDRMGLDEEIKKLNLGSNMIAETKGLEENTRAALLKKVAKEGTGRTELREIVKIVRNTSNTIKDALIKGEINVEQAEQLKGLKEEKQAIAIETIKSMNKQIKTIPKLVEKDKITRRNEKINKIIQLQQFIDKLQHEIGNASSQMMAIEGILQQIEEDELDKVFNNKLKNSLAMVLQELQETIGPTTNRIKKTIEKWRI
jgi:ParB-like chromosome segregation protein Spo0J